MTQVFGLYSPETYAALCVRGENEWGSSVYQTTATIDTSVLEWTYNGYDCMAAYPNQAYIINWGDPQEEGLATPDPQTITSDQLEAGQFLYVIGVYEQDNNEPRTYFNVMIYFTEPSGGLLDADFVVNGEDYHSSWDYSYSMEMGGSLTIEARDMFYLSAPPALTILASDLTEDMPNYDPLDDAWVYTLHYTLSDPNSSLVCVTAENSNGVVINPEAMFDGMDPLAWWEEEGDQECQWFPNSMDHVLAFYGLSGFEAPRDIYIPDGQLNANKTFDVRFVPTPKVAALDISVNKTAEIFINGRSFGWGESGYSPEVFIDRTVTNVLSFGPVSGFSTPAPITINAYDLDQWEWFTVTATYN
jgi:hypothetical protein